MKKSLFFCSALAVLALVSSCKKEQETVTLGVSIEQDAKMYINSDRTPYWNSGDQVYVNNQAYTIANPNGGSAQIPNVEASDNYCAIFPASIVATGSNISSGTFNVTLPERQKYEIVDGHQRVEIPMAAVSSNTSLQMHNLASILRVEVSNSTSADIDIKSITVTANNAYLSGASTATISGETTDNIISSSNGSRSVTLAKADNTAMATIAASTTTPTTFDVILPTFTDASTITVKVETTTGYQEFTKANVTLTNSTVTTVTANVNSLTLYNTTANLVDGPTFNAAIPTTATAVRFEYNSNVSSGTLLSTSSSSVPIYGNMQGNTWVVSTSASTINANPNCNYMFRDRTGLTSIDFGNGFNTSNVTNMSYMFCYCPSLTSLNLSNFNTSSVTDMEGMFDGCSGLTSLNVSNFNTSSVTNMSSMFSECYCLTSLNVSNFNTSSVTNMSYMFYDCYGLTSLNLSNFNTSSVTNMGGMFSDCYGLTSLNVSNFNTSNVTNMSYMFCYCPSLTSLNLSNFNTSSVTNMGDMFEYCRSLTSLNLSNFNTSSVTNMSFMFHYCSGLTSLNLYNFDMSSVTNKGYMCSNLATTSHACTITCPTAVRTELISGTNLPTSGVTFTWITH